MRLKIPRAPSKRLIRNTLAFYGGGTSMELPAKRSTPRSKPKRQAEAAVSEANRQWARLKGGRLVRNRRGMMDMPGGGKLPFGLPTPFIQDDVGYLPIRITPAMVGHTLPVLTLIEAKTGSGVVEAHQQAAIEEARDANCIAGVARNVEDCEALLAMWMQKWVGR